MKEVVASKTMGVQEFFFEGEGEEKSDTRLIKTIRVRFVIFVSSLLRRSL